MTRPAADKTADKPSLSLRLKECCVDLPDLLTVYVGEQVGGAIVAGYNPAHLDTAHLAAHTTAVWRGLRRLHSVGTRDRNAKQFMSVNEHQRLLVQAIEDTSLYLAFLTEANHPAATYQPTFKRVLELCRQHFQAE